jgi:uncharacterized Zn-binding protein involved in type VI secretion
MPGFLLHQAAHVQCPHGGQAQPTAASPRVLLGGQPVVTIASPYLIAGCADPAPPAGNGPCVSARFVTAAQRVLVMGQPVLLQDGQAVCQPTGAPLLVAATQTRVGGI